ncbi:hypothetical protein [Thermus caldifontis]|uniref:hypothetical protein n=1 Tax=Thermus caldifontis TaxID=1930763 RepID=UPI000DF22272|nr:hypothetical protein [Thermus caldifontis]
MGRLIRIVVQFRGESVFSFYTQEGQEADDLRRYLALFPGKKVERIEEQVYDPSHPRRFRYLVREDLMEVVDGTGD